MELAEWIGVQITENLDNRGSDKRDSSVYRQTLVFIKHR